MFRGEHPDLGSLSWAYPSADRRRVSPGFDPCNLVIGRPTAPAQGIERRLRLVMPSSPSTSFEDNGMTDKKDRDDDLALTHSPAPAL